MHTQSRTPGTDRKTERKLALQASLGWPEEKKRPMLCLPAGMSEKLGGALFQELVAGLLALPVEILVVGKGSQTFGTLFTKLSKDHKHRIHIVADSEAKVQEMIDASDMALFLTPPKGMKELAACMEAGVIPVSLPCAGLEDYDPVQESGNAFLFETADVWHCYAALVRAM
jgi:glycogen synthase